MSNGFGLKTVTPFSNMSGFRSPVAREIWRPFLFKIKDESGLMPSLNLTQKVHHTIDILIGLIIGWYRVRIDGPQTGRNENDHYVYPRAVLDTRLAHARNGPLTSGGTAIIQSARGLLSGIQNPVICDFGGAYGEECIRLKRFIPDAVCTIVEIPEIVRAANNVDSLKEFTFTAELPTSCDLFLSCGVVMNAHEPLFHAVKTMMPPRIIVSSVEITDAPTYWSMVVYKKSGRRCPYVTFNRIEFISCFEEMGYALKNHWFQGKNTSGVFLNGQENPDAYSFVFIRKDLI